MNDSRICVQSATQLGSSPKYRSRRRSERCFLASASYTLRGFCWSGCTPNPYHRHRFSVASLMSPRLFVQSDELVIKENLSAQEQVSRSALNYQPQNLREKYGNNLRMGMPSTFTELHSIRVCESKRPSPSITVKICRSLRYFFF